MDVHKLKTLIKQKEGMKLDFKEKLNLDTESEKKEFAKDIIAMANSIGGRGHLIVGVKDKTKELVGIDPEVFSEEQIQQIISYRCDPPVSIRAECISYQDVEIGVITIFKSSQRPHQMRQTGAFYIRRGSTTDFARREEIANMFQETGLISNELIPMYSIDINVLNRDLISQYLRKLGVSVTKKAEQEVWRSLGIIHLDDETNEVHPTIGGVLLFCDCPQTYLPYCAIKVITYEGGFKKIDVFEGNIIEMLNKCYRFVGNHLLNHDYPKEPVFQCIANAVVHRDYFDITREIVVLLGDHKIEISNPGTLPRGSNPHTIIKEINPPRRNNWLYQRLLTLDEEKRFIRTSFSLQMIHRILEKRGKVRFLNIEKRNMFKVILPGLKRQ